MASQAAIDGIAQNGLAWKARGPKIANLCKRIGEFRDSQDYEPKDLVRTAHAIASEINKWLKQSKIVVAADFEMRHGDDIANMQELTVNEVEASSRDELEQIVFVLSDIFDTFDYQRILVR